jgi:OFA family oxalate/formate antiporter-like MFS transporter
VHLALGALAMTALANAQFAVLARSGPVDVGLPESIAGLQSTFALFLFVETLLIPFERWFAERLGPRWLLALGSAGAAISWLLVSRSPGGRVLLLWSALGGVGAALFFAGSVTRALERFPDHWLRPVAAIAAAAALGAATAWPIAGAVRLPYPPALLPWSAAQGAILLVAATFLLRPPPAGWEPPAGA